MRLSSRKEALRMVENFTDMARSLSWFVLIDSTPMAVTASVWDDNDIEDIRYTVVAQKYRPLHNYDNEWGFDIVATIDGMAPLVATDRRWSYLLKGDSASIRAEITGINGDD